MNLLSRALNKLFKSSNQKEINRIKPIIDSINNHEAAFKALKDEEFKEKTIVTKLKKNILWHDGQPFTAHDVKFTFDTILNKKTNLYYFLPKESKLFFDTLESICQYNFKNKLGITSTLRYRYRGEEYNKSRLLYFTKSIQNKSCWLSFLKDNLFNLI